MAIIIKLYNVFSEFMKVLDIHHILKINKEKILKVQKVNTSFTTYD